ncbi:MAG: hypothetical protein KGY66_03755 [Candidatus Thermoplasmatota archaeon]|nr:hypothetical protein [Candidatus Thermoplasmatota archaeon]MBS3790012.1 hypothetical protein [Candidatus Thermoplasmatota archaeon]
MEEKDPDDKDCPHMSNDGDWLPLLRRDTELTLSLHPYCENCGLVRNVGPDRPRKLGYYVDKLSELENYLKNEDSKKGKNKLTEVHKRLIVKEMEEEKVFNDLYGVLASTQEEKFVEILKKYRPDLEECVIRYYLE